MKKVAPVPRRSVVLAVDDNQGNLIALEAVLADEYEVITALSGPEAIDIVKARKDIDLILMDLQMPGMDGFTAASHIKNIEGCEDLPIVFITAIYKEEPFIKRGYKVGAVDYFSKPFDPEILKMKVAIYSSFRRKLNVLKERERQIRDSEELLKAGRRLKSVLESLPAGVLIADVQGNIIQTNEEVSRIFRTQDAIEHDAYGEALGWWDSSGKVIKARGAPLARALYDGETSHNNVISIRCCDGLAKTILCSASPLFGRDGAIVGAVVVIQDVTETKKIEEDFEQRIAKIVTLGLELAQSAH